MPDEIFEKLLQKVLQLLKTQCDGRLFYHTSAHTVDVLEQALRIAKAEGITNKEDILLLKLACIYHDTGFAYGYAEHEEKSCEVFLNDVSFYKISDENKQRVCALILATKVPQKPHNLLEQIICDADLDYLGRDDFELRSNLLKQELMCEGLIKTDEDWMEKQLLFLNEHKYFTRSSKTKRNGRKNAILTALTHLQKNLG